MKAAVNTSSVDQAIIDLIVNIALLLICLPAHILLVRFLRKLKKPNIARVALCIPLCVIAWFFSSFESVKWFGIVGILGSLLQIFIASQFKRQPSISI